MKRIMLKKCEKNGKVYITFKMESTYRCHDPSKSCAPLMKCGMFMDHVKVPPNVTTLRSISDAKKSDLRNILSSRFGDNWKEVDSLKLYDFVINTNHITENENNENEECDFMHEEPGMGKV
ncbi:hypothetical protein ANN_28032 [Periplaneta americana]|uniref:Uncharacterized protein n=1 Tax=Periplaneta americana TaxID=6978 RepID=A0ABQ8RUS1_PERAM|nr:hypothetical protein ANN_28032 [Periplaneta americana]